MPQGTICPCSTAGQHQPAEPGSEKAHFRRKIGNLQVAAQGRLIGADDLRYRLVLVAESATLLEQHLESDRQGAALAGLLHQEAACIADTLDVLFDMEVANVQATLEALIGSANHG